MQLKHLLAPLAAMSLLGALVLTGAASQIPLRPMPPFHSNEKTCLSAYYDGGAAYWLNHCPYPVSVRWDDEAKCRNWSCIEVIPGNSRSAAAIARHARWCECAGTLKTCDLPATGC